MHLGDDRWLAALWAVPVAGLLVSYALYRRTVLLRRLADARLLPALAASVSRGRAAAKSILLLGALGAIIFGLARPQWDAQPHEVRRLGRDVCFVIDVSRSMLAEDLAPNRLERTKIWMRDVLSAVKGDRVAIVAFAGSAVVKCPLTHDYGFARMALDDLSPDSVHRGGTLIGDAVRLAQREDLAHDGHPADPARIWLPDRQRLRGQQCPVPPAGVLVLATGEADAGQLAQLAVSVKVVRQQRLLQPADLVLFDLAHDLGAGLAVPACARVQVKRDVRADLLAAGPHQVYDLLDIVPDAW